MAFKDEFRAVSDTWLEKMAQKYSEEDAWREFVYRGHARAGLNKFKSVSGMSWSEIADATDTGADTLRHFAAGRKTVGPSLWQRAMNFLSPHVTDKYKSYRKSVVSDLKSLLSWTRSTNERDRWRMSRCRLWEAATYLELYEALNRCPTDAEHDAYVYEILKRNRGPAPGSAVESTLQSKEIAVVNSKETDDGSKQTLH